MRIPQNLVAMLALCAGVSGCATNYFTPGSGVSFADIAESDLQNYYDVQPAAAFPANIAIVRVQDSGYVTRTARGHGHGRFTTITTRDVEDDADLEKIVGLPLVRSVAPVGRILLPSNASTIRDLRIPAAKLRADLLLVYSIDTAFSVEGKSLGPLSLISLGLIPNKKAHVTATVAGMLVDVRTGFVYGTTESTAREEQRATIWSTELAIDTSRIRAEETAFNTFVSEFGQLWKNVVDTHAATVLPVAVRKDYQDSHYRVRFNPALPNPDAGE